MQTLHRVGGFAIVGGWGLLLLWGVVLLVLRRDADQSFWGLRLFWRLLTLLQLLLGVQLLVGLVLLATGGRPPLLHYLYGAVFPALLLGVAHWLTRSLDRPPYHVFFTIGAFFIFGLTLRALMTGLGIG